MPLPPWAMGTESCQLEWESLALILVLLVTSCVTVANWFPFSGSSLYLKALFWLKMPSVIWFWGLSQAHTAVDVHQEPTNPQLLILHHRHSVHQAVPSAPSCVSSECVSPRRSATLLWFILSLPILTGECWAGFWNQQQGKSTYI